MSIEARTLRKMQIRILPFICVLFVVDRINIGFAALTMNKELTITNQQLEPGATSKPQRSFLIISAYPSVLIGESKTLGDERPVNPKITPKPDTDERQAPNPKLVAPVDWRGKELGVAVARTEERISNMTVAFNIANNSPRTVELLPPLVQLSGTARQKHHQSHKSRASKWLSKTIDWPHDVCHPVQRLRAR